MLRIPRRSGATRWAVIGWALLIFLWLSREDNAVWPVVILGVGMAFLGLWSWLIARYAGHVLTAAVLPLWVSALGAGVGVSGVLATVLLMIVKNVRHSHFMPDYPNAMLGAMLSRLGVWGLGGALIGAGLSVFWRVWREGKAVSVTATRIYFVRHGETDWNVERRFQGQAETDLNANGIAQVQAVAARIAALPETFSAIYSSPQRRALQTAQPIAERLGLPVQTEDALKEIFCGQWEGLIGDEIEAAFPGQLARWRSDVANIPMPGGECVGDVQRRGLVFFERVLRDHAGEAVIIVGHGASLLSLVAHTQGWNLTETWNDPARRIFNTAITSVVFADGATPHLERYNWMGNEADSQ